MTRDLTRTQDPVAPRRLRNTAEPSGELSVGDLVAVGEAALTVERLGWAPLRGSVTEVRLDEHGTHRLPASRRDPQGKHPAGQKEGDTAYEL